ncbi:MAG: N-6 DNA methylase [Caldisericum sp.]|uniref:N-6 DNA methylase n=1 Tax=Caldisericum sp. TaxID=2499687 RepID=UPI003D0D0943
MNDRIKTKNIINKIIPSAETEIPLLSLHLPKLDVYEKSQGEWYIKSHDADGKEKLLFDENKSQRRPEEIVRQLFLFELTDNYGYPIEKIKVEESVSFGREKKRADIVVYQEDGITPWIIVEVKEPNERLNIPQLKSYLNAEGSPIGGAVNGKEITILYRPYPKEFEDNLPDIPTYTEYSEVKNSTNPAIDVSEIVLSRNWTLEKLKEVNKQKKRPLRDIIETLEELVLANSGVDSFNEIFKLIYAKLYDEHEAPNRKDHQLKFRKYKDPQVTYKEISDLFNGAKKEWKGIFEKTEEIKLKPDHLNICVGEMQEMELFGADLRIIDEAFEYLVPEVSKEKKGQYFTPRVIIDAAVKMLNPHRKEYVIDPACGSSGFIVHAMQYVWKKYHMEDKDVKSAYAGRYLWGIDFEEKATKIARALMLIAGDGKAHIYQENSLEFTRWSEGFKADLKKEELLYDESFKELNFDILLTNPPFAGDIQEHWLKALYNDILPENKIKTDSTVDRHILFVERALDMIKPGGRLAIVLPQGVFNNTNDKYIREFIMKKARILAVVGLHGNSFKPHTGTKTSLLFLRKWKEDEPDKGENPKLKDYPIFFAVSKIPMKDNSGNYVFVKDENGNMAFDEEGNPVFQTDLFDIAEAFIKWGRERLKEGDIVFNFLNDVEVE